MFQSARLKLTTWYLLIIIIISSLYSVAFYNAATREISRIIRIEHARQQTFGAYFPLPPNLPSIEDLEAIKTRLKVILILFNTGIFIIAGGAGYFLAGRTLRPIKGMMEEQNRFITDASHELRTPLTAARTEIEVALRDKNLTLTEAKKLLASNLEEVQNLQLLSDNLLQLAQFQKPNGNHHFEIILLSEVIDHAVKKVLPLAKKKHIEIQSQQPEQYSLKGDKQSLKQLFVILLDNAIKYSSSKTTVTITTKKSDHSVSIDIADQGIGIEKKDISRIFDRFYRIDNSRTRQEVSGYGLGLSIAKKIVDEHKGTLSVKSEKGKGTTFTIQLPTKQT